VRWRKPDGSLEFPSSFIPLAESSGMIEQITPLVLRMALRQCRAWLDDGLDLTVAVNLSAKNVSNPSLPEMVGLALADAGLTPDHLVLEITESSVIDHTDETLVVLHDLRRLGVRIAIDDFGTGFSSLSYLHRLPVDILKIDRSFVENLSCDSPEGSLAASIIRIGEGLQLTTVAEGIEDYAQHEALGRLRCDLGQGYRFSPPVDASAFEGYLGTSSGGSPAAVTVDAW